MDWDDHLGEVDNHRKERKENPPDENLIGEYEQRAMEFVADKLLIAFNERAGIECPECGSRRVNFYNVTQSRGKVLIYKACEDCALIWDTGIDHEDV